MSIFPIHLAGARIPRILRFSLHLRESFFLCTVTATQEFVWLQKQWENNQFKE